MADEVTSRKKRIINVKNMVENIDQEYMCPVCKNALPNQHEFTVHIRQHKVSIINKGSLQSHICGICSKVLSSASSLDRHMLVHSGERPFKCKYCKMAFTTNGNMHRHMRTHGNHVTSKKIWINDETKTLKRKQNENSPQAIPEVSNSSCSPKLDVNGRRSPENDTKQVAKYLLKSSCKESTSIKPSSMSKCPDFCNSGDLSIVDFSVPKFSMIAEAHRKMPYSKSAMNSENVIAEVDSDEPLLKDRNDNLSNRSAWVNKNIFFSSLNLYNNKDTSLLDPASEEKEDSDDARLVVSTDFADIPSIISLTTKSNVVDQVDKSTDAVSPASVSHEDFIPSKVNSPKQADSVSTNSDIPDQYVEDQSSNSPTGDYKVVPTITFTKISSCGEYICNQCSIKFKTVHSVRRHIRLHHQNRSVFCCQVCNYTSGDKSTLIRHLRTHNGERPFQCSVCKYAFTTKANCERHIRKRHGLDDKVEIHNSMELNNATMQGKINSGDEISNENASDQLLDVETACKICNIDLKFNRILRHHMRTVHNFNQEKPFKCKVCNLGFSTKNNCCRHILKRHHTDINHAENAIFEPRDEVQVEVERSKSESIELQLDEINLKRSRLTDDELSSIEAIVNLSNVNISERNDQPLDLVIRALDLRIRADSDERQSDVETLSDESRSEKSSSHKCDVSKLVGASPTESSITSDAEVEQVLDLSKTSPKLTELTNSSTDQSETTAIKEETGKPRSADAQNGDLASISQLLHASKQAFPVHFDELEHFNGKISNSSSKKREMSDDSDSKNQQGIKKRLSSYSNSPNSVACPFCRRKFPWASSLRRHILTHTGQKPYKCSKCPLYFTTKSNCERHVFRKHDSKDKSAVAKEIIEPVAKSISIEDYSISVPIGEESAVEACKPSKNKSNKKGDDSAEDMPTGKNNSNNEHTYTCYSCDKGFDDREIYLNHLRLIHPVQYEVVTGSKFNDYEDTWNDFHPSITQKKISCSLCLKKFLSVEDLRRHTRTHSGEQPYICNLCFKRFSFKHNMSRHRKKHFQTSDQDESKEDEDSNNEM